MKFTEVFDIDECVYKKNIADEIGFHACFDIDGEKIAIKAIEGEVAERQAEAEKKIITAPLSKGVWYIFHKTLNGKYTPHRITMKLKTLANLERGSRKYGSAKILKEALEDF